MKKTIIKTGPNGSFEGSVEIKFNIRKEPTVNHIPMTGKNLAMRDVHVVRGNAEHETYISPEFYDIKDTVFHANKMEQLVSVQLTKMATAPKEKSSSVKDDLKNLGYV